MAWRTDTQLSISVVGGNKFFRGENPQPGTAISYYLKAAATGDVKITISDVTGRVVREIAGTEGRRREPRAVEPARRLAAGGRGGRRRPRGGRRRWWRRRARRLGGGPAIEPGTYLVKLSVNGKDYTRPVTVEADNY